MVAEDPLRQQAGDIAEIQRRYRGGIGGAHLAHGEHDVARHGVPVAQLLEHHLHRRVAHGEVAGGGGALVALEEQLDLVRLRVRLRLMLRVRDRVRVRARLGLDRRVLVAEEI